MNRRSFLATAASLLVAPRIGLGADGKVLRFAPQAGHALLDAGFAITCATRSHAFMVYDTLFGMDDGFNVSPQMLEGCNTAEHGRLWRLTLRDGLRFHDGEPVLARDVVASIRRWWRHDALGQELAAATDALSARSDKVVEFRLSRPFPLLPVALGRPFGHVPAIMPERLASAAPDRQVAEIIGSGPFRFSQAEHVPGSRHVYERFDGYVPRPAGKPSRTAGPKIVHLDRVEWLVMPDRAASDALAAGEVDWIEKPPAEMLPRLGRHGDIAVRRIDTDGVLPLMRFNQLHAPFDHPGIRRAVLHAVSQAKLLTAAAGADRSRWQDKVGVFAHGSPLANDVGMEALDAPLDLARARRELTAAGYKGERVVALAPGEDPALKALAQAGAELLTQIGFELDLQVVDREAMQQRLTMRDSVGRGGWSLHFTTITGAEACDPACHENLRGLGLRSIPGWPTSARLEALRTAWFAAGTPEEQKAMARQIQQQVLTDLPYVPLGQIFDATAHRRTVSGLLNGFPLFHNLRKA
jgi:peptide/nickel transport system substrate-binding protein